MNVFCCSVYLVRVLIMGMWSEFSAYIVCQVVRLYSVGVSVFSVMCSKLLIMSEIS